MRGTFDDLFYFEAVLRHRGFAPAARELGVAKSMGLTCEGQDPKAFQAKLRAGDYDDRFS